LSVIMIATRTVRGMASPAWRSLLEARWEERVDTLTELSLAYHDEAARSASRHTPGGPTGPDGPGETRELKRLMRDATVARRALRDTEEALARLSAGGYGSCEQCGASIPAATLLLEPEARYCPECVKQATAA
jgi:DnaK suppressor protein